jgi:adenylate cyclase class 2
LIEREVKFLVPDFGPYRKALHELGAPCTSSYFEDNIIYDDERGSLRKSEKVLRLRKGDRTTLTLKIPAPPQELVDSGESRYKVREEYEIEISDFETAEKIVTELGFRKSFRYQKNREVFTVGPTSVLLDHTPIGEYIEIEGDRNSIETLADELNLTLDEGITENYMSLYAEYRRQNSKAPEDMVF